MNKYYKWFFLSPEDANMQFANPKNSLRVAPLQQTSSLKDLAVEWEYFAFAEKNIHGGIEQYYGLKCFLELKKPNLPPIYIFDNHNHALYFRYLEFLKTHKISKLFHIDQHSDMNDNPSTLSLHSEQEVFHFTQRHTNVGNFIQPALKSWLISDVQMILTDYSLKHLPLPQEPYILDIDLDFRSPEMGNDIKASLPILQKTIQQAECVTIATSPYFLDQRLAIELIRSLLSD